MRGHCKLHPPTGSKHKELSKKAQTILSRPCSVIADFSPAEALTAVPKLKVARFAPNPGKERVVRTPATKCYACASNHFYVVFFCLFFSLLIVSMLLTLPTHLTSLILFVVLPFPEPNWGPKRRAGRADAAAEIDMRATAAAAVAAAPEKTSAETTASPSTSEPAQKKHKV
jgi:hypothetical protein